MVMNEKKEMQIYDKKRLDEDSHKARSINFWGDKKQEPEKK